MKKKSGIKASWNLENKEIKDPKPKFEEFEIKTVNCLKWADKIQITIAPRHYSSDEFNFKGKVKSLAIIVE